MIPSTFAPVKPQDVTLIPVPVLKNYSINNTQTATTSSGYNLVKAVYVGVPTPIGAPQANNDPINTTDSSYQHVMWHAINHLYYKNPYDNGKSFEHNNRRYTFKYLGISASMLSIPYLKYGQSIHPGSLSITSSLGYKLKEDKNGNLYDVSISTQSFAPRYSVVGYWGFNNVYNKNKRVYGKIIDTKLDYISRVYEPDERSIGRNILVKKGVEIANTGSGFGVGFLGDGYVYTIGRKELNFDSKQDFTISFWAKIPVSQSVITHKTNALITKRGTTTLQQLGNLPKYNLNNLVVNTLHVSSSITDFNVDFYPYNFEVYNHTAGVGLAGKVVFKRSDGLNTTTLTTTSSLQSGRYNHIALTKSGSNVRLYLNGVLHQSITDKTNDPINDHCLMFGSTNLASEQGLSGSLDEVRIYNYALTPASIQTLSDNSSTGRLYQTAVVGNVFYRKGNIVISPLNPKYQNILHQGSWTCNYRGKHVIYQYEVLCRAKKGQFNMSLNPSAKKSANTTVFRDEMTGSLLSPYATTVGLYSDKNELLAVGKLSQPLQMRSDVDINFLVRWDV